MTDPDPRDPAASPPDPDGGRAAARAASGPGPGARDAADEGRAVHPAARFFARGPWEMGASVLIALGVVMLMQPFALWAYTWSFAVLLVGTVGFVVVSHFPEGR